MLCFKKLSGLIEKNHIFIFLYIPVTALFFMWGMLLACYPDIAAEGVSDGIKLCLETIVPSLFPFIFFSSLLSESGVLDRLSLKAEKATHWLFRLPGIAAPIIILSMTGGFPVGAFLIKKAYEKGELTSLQGRRMLLFCVNPGPAFTISTIGSMLLGSKQAGVIIYISTAATSLFIGFLSRFFAPKEEADEKHSVVSSFKSDVYTVISRSVSSCSGAIVNICVWIVIFSCVNKLAESLPLNQSIVMFVESFSEVTNGVVTVMERYPLPLVSGIISFAGICVHLQILPALVSLKLKYKHFLAVRIAAASLSTVISGVLFRLFPVSVDTVSIGVKPVGISNSSSPAVCVCLLLMCGLFIIGDNYMCRLKKEKRTDI